jgi:hypothetical protein
MGAGEAAGGKVTSSGDIDKPRTGSPRRVAALSAIARRQRLIAYATSKVRKLHCQFFVIGIDVCP